MHEITRSRAAMGLAAAGGALFALGLMLEGLAFVVINPLDVNTSDNLHLAGLWLQFTGAFSALVAVGWVTWQMATKGVWPVAAELGAAWIGTLLFTVAMLVAAANPNGRSQAANIVAAVGLGVWMLAFAARAFRSSLAEQQGRLPGSRESPLWLGAATGVLVVAVTTGLSNPSYTSKPLPIVQGTLGTIGFTILALTLSAARSHGMLKSHANALALAGLWTLGAASLATAIAEGITFGPSATLTGVKVGVSVPVFIESVGWITLGLSALSRVYQLHAATPTYGAPPTYMQSTQQPGRSAPPGPAGWPPSQPAWEPPPPPYASPGSSSTGPSAPEWVSTAATVSAPNPETPAPTSTSLISKPGHTIPSGTAPGTVASSTFLTPATSAEQKQHCGQVLPDDSRFCPLCGASLGTSGG